MNRLSRLFGILVSFGFVSAAFAVPERVESFLPEEPPTRSFGYSLVQVSPLVQYTPDLFEGPYFYFTLTNTGTQSDTIDMSVSNLTNGNFFGQVCIEQICFPGSTSVILAPNQSKLVGVNLVPFDNGVCTADFDVASQGDPGHTDFYQVTLWAGSTIGVPEGLRSLSLQLEQNAPNPVRESTRIAFTLPNAGPARLAVYDVAGRLVRTLADGGFAAGSQAVSWNGRAESGERLASGVYLVRLTTASGAAMKSLTLVK